MASDWMMNQVKSTLGGSPTAVPPVKLPVQVKQPTKPTVQPTQTISQPEQKDWGLVGKGMDLLKKVPGLTSITGNVLNTLNKVAIDPMRRFAAGAFEENLKANREGLNPNSSLGTKIYGSLQIPAMIKGGIENLRSSTPKYFGQGADITGGMLPDKPLISPEQGKAIDNPVTDFLIGKGSAGQLTSAFSNPNWGANLVADVATPGVPIGKILKPVVKGITGTEKFAQASEKVGQFVKDRPRLAGTLERIIPGSVYPVAEQAMKDANFTKRIRQSGLYQELQTLMGGLNKEEKMAVGQMMEGGVASKSTEKIKYIANKINKISDDIGKELVQEKLLSPESFAKYEGQYLAHINNKVIEELAKTNPNAVERLKNGILNFFSKETPTTEEQMVRGQGRSFVSDINNPQLKKRTGQLTDYSRQADAVSQLALGSEIGAIEKSKAAGKIIGEYGKNMNTGVPIMNPARQGLNELLSEGKKREAKIAKFNLGTQIKPAYSTPENIGNEMLDVFKKNQPARQVAGEGVGMGVKGAVGDVAGKGTPGFEGMVGHGTPGYSIPDVPTAPGTLPKGGEIGAKLPGIGELPQKPPKPIKLSMGKAIPTEAPKGWKLVDDVAGMPENLRVKYSGVAIPSVVADKLVRSYTPQTMGPIDKLMNIWKQFKTTAAGTPAYFVRNQKSNIYQSAIKTGRNVIQTAKDNLSSMAELVGIKKSDPITLREFKEVSDMTSNIDKVKALLTGKKEMRVLSPSDFQRWQELGAKYDLFKYYKKQGMNKLQAWEEADSTIFSPFRISADEKGATRFLIPFYQWQRQEIPFFLKTYAENPERYAVYTKAKEHIEQLSPEPKVKPPDYYQGQIRLPAQDQSGDNLYLDETYSLPFGSFLKSTGENDLPLGFNPNPLLDVKPILEGRNPQYGTPLTKSSIPEEQSKAKRKALAETFGPTAIKEYGTNLPNAIKGTEEPYTGKTRSLGQWVLRNLGTKIAPYSEKKQARMNQYSLSDLQSNHQSFLKSIAGQRSRREIDQAEYQRLVQRENEEYRKQLTELRSK